MSYLDRLLALTTSAETPPSEGSKAPSEPFEGELPGQIHPGLLAAVVRLETMVRPPSCELRTWRQMVEDARGMVEAGWGENALALGWSEVDLFGIAKDRRGGKQIVEHVHVAAGGQAVIANNVTTGGGAQ